MTWIRLVYGTAVLVALSGVAIFYGGSRAVIRPVDMAELFEATHERLMPFGYDLTTNTIAYDRVVWAIDPSTNRWQDGTNQRPYLVFSSIEPVTDSFVNVSGISEIPDPFYPYDHYAHFVCLEDGGTWYFWDENFVESPVLTSLTYSDLGNNWRVDVVQTGRVLNAGIEYPAYQMVVHPNGVGVWNNSDNLDYIDSLILGVIPRYVDHEMAIGGRFTNASPPMLTVSAVWARLELPCVWTNVIRTPGVSITNWIDSWTNADGVTNVTMSGTNMVWTLSTNITATNYTFSTGPICTKQMLTERYKALSYLRWTRGSNASWATTKTSITNVVLDINSSYLPIGYIRAPPMPDGPPYPDPDYPPEWDWTATNRYFGAFYFPSNTPSIFDSDEGESGTATNVPHRPERQYISRGSYSKQQSIIVNWLGYNWHYSYVMDTSGNGTNFVTKYNSSPVVRVPYNIGGISVTGDVYLVDKTNAFYWAETALMTASNISLSYTGSVITLTNRLFAPTNYVYWVKPGSVYVETNGISWWYGDWNTGEKTWWVESALTILKWSFSRCHP